MKTVFAIFIVSGVLGCATGANASAASKPAPPARATISFDTDWRFLKSDASDAEQPGFSDGAWRKLDVPHDWSIEGPFAGTNSTRGSGGFLPAGVGWYRKHFTLPATLAQRRVFIDFDGVMANSDVWINGVHLGHRPYGYVSFCYELTRHLKFGDGQTNVLAVRADNSRQPASRWYTGAGIYRRVRLVATDPVHIEQDGVFVTTPQVSTESATVSVRTTITNHSDRARKVTLQNYVLAPGQKYSEAALNPWNGPMPEATIAPNGSAELTAGVGVEHPRLWDLQHPELYQLVSRIMAESAPDSGQRAKLIDEVITPFGIRQFEFRADTGFWLNGQHIKIKGVCLHHDGGAFGAAVPLGVWEQRLEALRSLGVNAIRTAHNPPAPEFLDLCDRMGFLVMDEMFDCWTVAKNPYDYHLFFNEWSHIDTQDTVRRDRNHPSVILYSAGNEIHDTPKEELAKQILTGLVEVFHTNDPTRPVTQALFRPNVSHDYDNGLADLLDVIGTNYRDNELLAAHAAKPTRKIIGTEQRHDRQTWLWARDSEAHAGQFLWSGIDYLGEARGWPSVGAGSGLLDRTGAAKPMSGERASWWSEKPVVFAVRRTAARQGMGTDPGFAPLESRQFQFADWTPRNLEPHDENVEVYSNCEEAELLLNGKSLGSKPRPEDDSPRTWQVAFAPGTLEAVGRNQNRVAARQQLRTAGKTAKIVLTANVTRLAADWDGVSVVRATVADANGVPVPGANDLITFKVTGPGVVAAVDNGDNASHEPFQASERYAYLGQCVAFVKATAPSGQITLTASAPGLASGSVRLTAVAPGK